MEGQNQPKIYIVNPDGGGSVALTRISHSETDSVWFPDGQWIAFTAQKTWPVTQDLFVMRADGSGLKRLTDFPNDEMYPTWSPDSQCIAFSCGDYARLNRCLIRPDGNGFQKILSSPDSEEYPGGDR